MLDRIRRRLTLGYVTILALILIIFGVLMVFLFRGQAYAQQDELLLQEAKSKAEGLLAGREQAFIPTRPANLTPPGPRSNPTADFLDLHLRRRRCSISSPRSRLAEPSAIGSPRSRQ